MKIVLTVSDNNLENVLDKSSIVNQGIRPILNLFFYEKISHAQKSIKNIKNIQSIKTTKSVKKHKKRKKRKKLKKRKKHKTSKKVIFS